MMRIKGLYYEITILDIDLIVYSMYNNKNYHKEYYERNKEKYHQRYKHNKVEVVKRTIHRIKTKMMRRRYWLDKYKCLKGCKDCGYNTYPVVLEFDHIDMSTKVNTVGYLLLRSSLKSIFNEIRKCELVCRNCHTIRTEITRGHETNSKRYATRWNMVQNHESTTHRFYYSQ